jgi:hypothetical protein
MNAHMNTVLISKPQHDTPGGLILKRIGRAFQSAWPWKRERILIRSRRALGAGQEFETQRMASAQTKVLKEIATVATSGFCVDPAWIPPEGFFVLLLMGSVEIVRNFI